MAHIAPPFTKETAQEKLKFAQAMWNTQNPEQVAKGYTPDCIWRNRDKFIQGMLLLPFPLFSSQPKR